MEFSGLERPNNLVGIRNTILVMAAADCAEPVARMIAEGIEGAVSVSQYQGCIDMQVVPTLTGVARNANVFGTLLVAMGCEGQQPEPLKEEIAKSGKPVEIINIQAVGGTRRAISKGREIVRSMAEEAKRQQRAPFDIGRLIVGVKCGGSDTTSGIAANPAIGVTTDMLVDAGAAVVMGEPIEAIGAEKALSSRAENEEVRRQIMKWIGDEEKRWTVPGAAVDFMCRGNIEGGLTTLEEKSLGAIHKSGHRLIKGVLKNKDDYLETVPPGGGLFLQEGVHVELHSMTYMAAAGVHLIIFTTGQGGSFGHAISPLIKVTGNPDTWARMNEDMDINASTIMEGNESIESVGKRIFDEVLAVASGKLTIGEQLGMYNFAIWKRDPRLEALLGLQ
ncbi:MAG: UxaA family hydrolase [Deltaproteobacteria bacterium]|nr:UxaA family hydrolase [Deltaproteobacteria bacterium]MBW1860897.1 UxaA family hydrolase [Deltaproteobacteria bacterium]